MLYFNKGMRNGMRREEKISRSSQSAPGGGCWGFKIQKVKVRLGDDRQRERWEIPLLKQTAKLWICVFKRACGRSGMNFLPELVKRFCLIFLTCELWNKLAHICNHSHNKSNSFSKYLIWWAVYITGALVYHILGSIIPRLQNQLLSVIKKEQTHHMYH